MFSIAKRFNTFLLSPKNSSTSGLLVNQISKCNDERGICGQRICRDVVHRFLSCVVWVA